MGNPSSRRPSVEAAWVAFCEGPRASVHSDAFQTDEYLSRWLYRALQFGWEARVDHEATGDRTPWAAALDERESARLLEYASAKGMSTSAVLRHALRVYDLMEQTPGAYEVVRALGPQLPTMPPDAVGEAQTCTEKDAARYEWLRENWKGLVCHTSCSSTGRRVDFVEVVETLGQDLDPQSIDHAIDAAMKADDERSAEKTTDAPDAASTPSAGAEPK